MGDLSKKVEIHTVENDPEILKVKITINTMMDQLQTFANEVTKVATEVANGELGGQAKMMDLLVFGDHLQTMLILWLLI